MNIPPDSWRSSAEMPTRANPYREMYLLTELTRNPAATQRELSKRLGVALGLTNLMLRRLAKKGYIKVKSAKRSRIRYLITPTGILEKSRLTYEYVHYSLQLYARVRRSLRHQLTAVAHAGSRKILVFGTGELAEIAFLTIHEMGLQLVGMVEEPPTIPRFLGYPVRRLAEVSPEQYDRVIIASLGGAHSEMLKGLAALGVPAERIITLTEPSLRALLTEEPSDQEGQAESLETGPTSTVALEQAGLAEPLATFGRLDR